jgi:hypothetical protein
MKKRIILILLILNIFLLSFPMEIFSKPKPVTRFGWWINGIECHCPRWILVDCFCKTPI